MDRLTPEQRHKNMKAIKNKDSRIELLLRKELWKRGVRYQKNSGKVYGHPDIVFIGKKVAVFCDSEFWHGYNWETRKNDIKSNRDYWISKIERNIARDKEVNAVLESQGWKVIRFWGNEILKETDKCVNMIMLCLEGTL